MPQFTKNAIINSFIDLITERPLDKITVKDIVTHCGINRNTFYYYFEDIYALIDELFKIETERIIGEEIDFNTLQDAFLKAINFSYENRSAIYHIYKSINRERVEIYLNSVTYNNIYLFIKNETSDLNVEEEDIKLLSKFYSHALVGMILEWLSDGMRGDPKEFISRLAELLEGNVRFAFKKNI